MIDLYGEENHNIKGIKDSILDWEKVANFPLQYLYISTKNCCVIFTYIVNYAGIKGCLCNEC